MVLKRNKGISYLITDKISGKIIDLKKYLSMKEYKFIIKIGKYADEFGISAYLVGGFVRDIFLCKKDIDIDITVEGDGMKFTEFLARKLNAPYKCFEKFKTGKIFLKNKFNIDITSARSEYYDYPAALPQIKFSFLQKDLYRRDFTINAMAIKINRSNFGEFIDFFNGLYDLKKGIIRVLHNKSFIDDPTRILRAIRFEQRLDFKIEKNTLDLIKNTIKQNIFEKVPGERLRDEILLILKEKNAIKILKRGRQLKILDKIFKDFKINNKIEQIYKNISIYIKKQIFKNIDIDCVFFMIFSYFLNNQQTYYMVDRLKLKNEWKNKILNVKKYEKIIIKRLKKVKYNKKEMYVLLNNFSKEELFYFVLLGGDSVYKIIEKYFKIHNSIKLYITGSDLKRMGIKEGPIYKKLLQQTLLEKIDGRIKTKSQEINFIKEKIKGGNQNGSI